ncbi:MAG TPA: hypothetical protein VNS79_03770 [Sphingobium sp.]|nr:hypothetical protein [Sphingobium sp.]
MPHRPLRIARQAPPTRKSMARRFADAMEPGDLDAIYFGTLGGLAVIALIILFKCVSAVLVALATLGSAQ